MPGGDRSRLPEQPIRQHVLLVDRNGPRAAGNPGLTSLASPLDDRILKVKPSTP